MTTRRKTFIPCFVSYTTYLWVSCWLNRTYNLFRNNRFRNNRYTSIFTEHENYLLHKFKLHKILHLIIFTGKLPCVVSTIGISLGLLLLELFVTSVMAATSWLWYRYPPAWSNSWLTPQEKTKEHSEWKWVNITIAWTTSARDQLSFPLVNFYKEKKKVIHFSKKILNIINKPLKLLTDLKHSWNFSIKWNQQTIPNVYSISTNSIDQIPIFFFWNV